MVAIGYTERYVADPLVACPAQRSRGDYAGL